MPEPILCKICGKRRARRWCPAVEGDICPICCGEHREVTYSCPLECEYLQEAHRRERPQAIAERDLRYSEIRVTEDFIRSHEELLLFCIYSVLQAALRTTGAVDTDVLEALAALIQTQKTLDSGLVYETMAENTVAAAVQRLFSASVVDYQKLRRERESLSPIRNSEWLAIYAFLYRLGQQSMNGRPRGRMYLDMLRHMAPETSVDERAPSIIL